MKRRLKKKALKWFIAHSFCLIDPIPPIKGKYKLVLWNQWKDFNKKMKTICCWHNVAPLIESIENKLPK